MPNALKRPGNIILIAVALLLVAAALFFLWPRAFTAANGATRIDVAYSRTYLDKEGMPQFDTESAALAPSDPAFQQVLDVLAKNSYHLCLDSLWNGAAVEGNIEVLGLYFANGSPITLTDTSRLIVGDRVYQIGYHGDSRAKELISELKQILQISQ